MISESSKKRAYLTRIDSYLKELGTLIGKRVEKSDMMPIESIDNVRRASRSLRETPVSKFEIRFPEKESERFKAYIERLHRANESGVYIWTEKSNLCGLYKAKSLKHIDFSFPFDINDEGVLAFLCDNLKDELLLDFSSDLTGQQVISVECQGINWPDIDY